MNNNDDDNDDDLIVFISNSWCQQNLTFALYFLLSDSWVCWNDLQLIENWW